MLIGLSGGEGVEHLAVEYSSKGKPVIPIDLQLGASERDGSGGASRLFDRAWLVRTIFSKSPTGYLPETFLIEREHGTVPRRHRRLYWPCSNSFTPSTSQSVLRPALKR